MKSPLDALHCESLKGNARTYAQAYLIPMTGAIHRE